jgi:hypothetical protein
MVAIHLDTARQQQLERLASAEGRAAAELARQIVEDYLDLDGLRELSPDEWAEGCVALSPEVFPDENWDQDARQASAR